MTIFIFEKHCEDNVIYTLFHIRVSELQKLQKHVEAELQNWYFTKGVDRGCGTLEVITTRNSGERETVGSMSQRENLGRRPNPGLLSHEQLKKVSLVVIILFISFNIINLKYMEQCINKQYINNQNYIENQILFVLAWNTRMVKMEIP